MIIDKEQNLVSFKIDDNLIHMLELSAAMDDVKIDDYFEEFIGDMARRALRASMRRSEENRDRKNLDGERIHRPFMFENPNGIDSTRNTEACIRRWAIHHSGTGYALITVFLACQEDGENFAYRKNMLEFFNKNFSSPQSLTPSDIRFLNRFRLMCSDARGAYGQIFNYEQETDKVTLNKAYEPLILSYKTMFTL